MNPDYFPPQLGLPIAGALFAGLALQWHLDRRKKGGARGDVRTQGAKARRGQVRESAEGAVATVAAGSPEGARPGDRRGDPRIAGRRWSVVAAGLAVALAGLTGCSAISAGTVTDKHSRPGYFYTTTSCRTVNKTTTCTPSTLWMPPTWRLDLRDGEKSGWVNVSNATFDRYQVGEVYP
ncbi:hypothetical protein QE418_000647 [Microbacterium testaceum]|nr:hypothetical protein [Microbacterium testaceum]MDR6098262.1 hypothetical protein [Microbacterium sp. SORGH_AS_0454]